MTHVEALQYAIDSVTRHLDSLDRMSPNRAIVVKFTAQCKERRRLLAALMPAAVAADAAPLADRLWAQVDRNGPVPDYAPHLGPCWLWTGALTKEGYGHFSFKSPSGKWTAGAPHLVSWVMERGAVPKGLTLDHLCRVRRCVRPSHLEPVTMRENTMRGFGVSALNARKTECKYGHSDWMPDGHRGRRCRTCNDPSKRTKVSAP